VRRVTEVRGAKLHSPVTSRDYAAEQNGTKPMPEVTLTTYILCFAVVLVVIPFAWAMVEYRSLPRSKRPNLGTQGVGSLTYAGGGRMRLK
jgi:hypothetical protein